MASCRLPTGVAVEAEARGEVPCKCSGMEGLGYWGLGYYGGTDGARRRRVLRLSAAEPYLYGREVNNAGGICVRGGM